MANNEINWDVDIEILRLLRNHPRAPDGFTTAVIEGELRRALHFRLRSYHLDPDLLNPSDRENSLSSISAVLRGLKSAGLVTDIQDDSNGIVWKLSDAWPPSPPNGRNVGLSGGNGGDGGAGAGGGEADDDNFDGGLHEVLSHTALFSLPKQDFVDLVGRLFEEPGEQQGEEE